jgi:hypothetical protein
MGVFARIRDIKPETVLHRKRNLLSNTIDSEIVLLSIENNEYYGMDKVGSRIWELLAIPISFNDLIFKLMEEYEVSEDQCKADTIEFINQLTQRKLIKVI